MRYIQGRHRDQTSLFPIAAPAHPPSYGPAPRIEAFVETLDLRKIGLEPLAPAGAGRPAYDPRDLLKLHLYGAARGLHSCRRLQRAAAEEPDLAWLLGGIQPKFRTIADFKRKHGEVVRKAALKLRVARRAEPSR